MNLSSFQDWQMEERKRRSISISMSIAIVRSYEKGRCYYFRSNKFDGLKVHIKLVLVDFRNKKN